MAAVLQRKRSIIDAVTDGQRSADTSGLDAVVHALRERAVPAALRTAA